MDCGEGRSYFCRLSYRPVPGVRKSGMPADTLMPAPTMTMTLGCASDASSRAIPPKPTTGWSDVALAP